MDFDYLMQDPPTTLEINGKEYPIDSSYRNCLAILECFEDSELSDNERLFILLNRLYRSVDDSGECVVSIPPDTQEAVNAAVYFLDCGERAKKNSPAPVYSMKQDGMFIRSAIERTHKVRLKDTDFHWWEFCYMFYDLDADCFFNTLVSIRSRRAKGKLTKEEREFVNKNLDIVNLRVEAQQDHGHNARKLQRELLINQKYRAHVKEAKGRGEAPQPIEIFEMQFPTAEAIEANFKRKYEEGKRNRRAKQLREAIAAGTATEDEREEELNLDLEQRYSAAIQRRLGTEGGDGIGE